jgi:hypothetical protein
LNRKDTTQIQELTNSGLKIGIFKTTNSKFQIKNAFISRFGFSFLNLQRKQQTKFISTLV